MFCSSFFKNEILSSSSYEYFVFEGFYGGIFSGFFCNYVGFSNPKEFKGNCSILGEVNMELEQKHLLN